MVSKDSCKTVLREWNKSYGHFDPTRYTLQTAERYNGHLWLPSAERSIGCVIHQ